MVEATELFVLGMWVLGALMVLGSFGYRFVNLLGEQRYYQWTGLWVNFVALVFGWGFLFIANLLMANLSFNVFTTLFTWIFVLNSVLFVAEVFFLMARTATSGLAKNSMQEARKAR